MGSQMRWYYLDDADRIVEFGPGWPDANAEYIGRPVWDILYGTTIRLIYAKIFERVRATGAAASVDIRCDQPNQLIALRLAVTHTEDGLLRVGIDPVREAATEYRPLWDPDAVRSGQNVRACSWCQSIQVGEGEWLPFVEAVRRIGLLQANTPPEISHGICDGCLDMLDMDDAPGAR